MNSLLQDETLRIATYLVSAALCLGASAVGFLRSLPRRQVVAWGIIGAFLISLAVLRLLDFQGLAANEGREIAKAGGWYQDRREYQKLLILGLMAAGAVLAIAVAALFEWRLSMIAAASLVCFLCVRAVSLHQVDALLYRRSLEGLQPNALAEFSLVALVGLASLSEGVLWPTKVPLKLLDGRR